MHKRQAYLLRGLYFLVFCCTASWLPLFADLCHSRGFNGLQTAILLSATPFLMLVLQPLNGMIADRLGYKPSLLAASLLTAICYLGYLIEGGFYWMLTVTILMSAFYNNLQPILDSLSLQIARRSSTFSYGSLRLAGAAGWSFTGIVAGQLIDLTNIRIIIWIASASMFLVFLLALALQPVEKKEALLFSSLKPVKELLSTQLLILLGAVLLVSAGGTTIWNFYSLYMKEQGATASLVGYGLSLQGLCELPFFYFSARILMRWGIKKTLFITVMATALRLLLYGLIHNPAAVIPVELLHGISWSLFWVACVEYVNQLVPEEWMATGQSLLYAAYYGAGAIAGNLWTGWLSDRQFPYTSIFLWNAAFVVVVAVLIALFMKRERSDQPA
jgi:PPP family 3-phenylpropionic acid transporter